MMVALSLAVAIATLLWFASPVIFCYGQGYGGGGGGGGGGTLYPKITFLRGITGPDGLLTAGVSAGCPDKPCKLEIEEGTRAQNKEGAPLFAVIVDEPEPRPGFPEDYKFVLRLCEFEPEGATFEPPAILTCTYDPDDVPKGADENNLVFAMCNDETGEWFILGSTVYPDDNIISTSVSHLTSFAVLACVAPAAFTVADLAITPDEVGIGESVTISALVSNTGCLEGSYDVTLEIDGEAVATDEVTLSGQASQKVTFTASKDTAGNYEVNIRGLTGTFKVGAAPPPPAPPPEPAPAPTPAPAPPPPKPPINWYLIGGIIGAIIIIGVVITFVVRR